MKPLPTSHMHISSMGKWALVRSALITGEFENLTEEQYQNRLRILRNIDKIKSIRKYVNQQQSNLKFYQAKKIDRAEFSRKYFQIWRENAKLCTDKGQKFGIGIERVWEGVKMTNSNLYF